METLSLFDLTGLVNALNEKVQGGSFRFLDEVVNPSKRNPLINRIDGSQREIVGKRSVFNNNRKAGYLFFEKGKISDESDNIAYEQIKLCLYPLELKDGKRIPKSTIKIYIEETYSVLVERRDHVKKYHLFWKKTDLSSVFPISYFLPESVSRRIVKRWLGKT